MEGKIFLGLTDQKRLFCSTEDIKHENKERFKCFVKCSDGISYVNLSTEQIQENTVVTISLHRDIISSFKNNDTEFIVDIMKNLPPDIIGILNSIPDWQEANATNYTFTKTKNCFLCNLVPPPDPPSNEPEILKQKFQGYILL